MTKSNTIEDKIRKIITYHSDDGTSGYLLSEDQIADIGKLIDQAEKERRRNEKQNIGMLRQFLNERVGNKLLTNKDLEVFILDKNNHDKK